VLIAPDDVAADHADLLFVAGVVGAVPSPWPSAGWPPVLTSAGEIKAPGIGFARPRAKG
jgi:hypothetical protein